MERAGGLPTCCGFARAKLSREARRMLPCASRRSVALALLLHHALFACADERPSLILMFGYPGSGKTTAVRALVELMPIGGGGEGFEDDGGCAWVRSRAGGVAVLGKWQGFHSPDPPCTSAACRYGQRVGDGTDRLRPQDGLMTVRLPDALRQSCASALAGMREAGTRLVVADGFAADDVFVDDAERAGYRVRIIELDVDATTAGWRREARDGRVSQSWHCDDTCKADFEAVRANPRHERLSDVAVLELFQRAAGAKAVGAEAKQEL